MKLTPPKFADRLLESFCTPELLEEIQGDLLEMYRKWDNQHGERKAKQLYYIHVLKFIRPFAIKKNKISNQNLNHMFNNFFITAIRSLRRHASYTALNVVGLSVGLVSCTLIGMYMFAEWQVDRFQENKNQLYRVTTEYQSTTGDVGEFPAVGRALTTTISSEVPEVKTVIPIYPASYSIKHENQYYYEEMLFAGDSFLQVFSFPLQQGNPNTALSEPNSLVITKNIAEKYFGEEEALGKTLMLDDSLAFKVTGVLAASPASHIKFDVLVSLPTFYALAGDRMPWFTWDAFCYVQLEENANPQLAEQKISALSMKHNREEYTANGYMVSHQLEPFADIYLHSKLGGINTTTGNIQQLYLLAGIALFILLLACINFINLTTAQQSEKAREVGIRKAMGASRSSLTIRFIGEALMLVLLAGLLAIPILSVSLPALNDLTGKNLSLRIFQQPVVLGCFLGFFLFTGIVAGSYPALLLSRLKPLETLKGKSISSRSSSKLRSVLVVFQFCISLMLIISTMITFSQLRFMQNQDLGFDKDQVMVIDARKVPRRSFIQNYEGIKQELDALAQVETVSASSALPGRSGWEGQLVWPEGRSDEESVTMEVVLIDQDYVNTLGLNMKAGRNFSTEYPSDAEKGVLVNEAACHALGWKPEEAIGKKVSTSGMDDGEIVGVVADYHQHGLQEKIKPILAFMAPYAFGYFSIRTSTENATQLIQETETYWKSRFPGYPFEYYFLDQDFDRQYQSEQQIARMFTVFSCLAILIACLGLFGLATFMAEKRIKEIGIRKVLGASVENIVQLLSKDFLKLILLANIIAWPLTWFLMRKWLQNYAYQTEISIWIFVLAGALGLSVVLLTVSFQSVKAALANPVDSLRNE